ncbi:hypothetical protein LTS16_025189 [Friedmanniomyces endolithicus]|nr:hypothetical protein LTR35_016215 [Friedmanniomyces endolithicus]KAK0269319.1 hypothetical protein LTS00_017314 [Friedmanniomyces endolithicus]KAK0302425.1 hypothetical protein LTR01_008749 [Friedmanniomyces endolithicus]KAK0823151.1 hypothetical protein LTR73_008772 [Friedmanniomyces endolithicus]KAK0909114.1 hypothetical protein LTR57_016473 [Friedmanniomyces endolithicus]
MARVRGVHMVGSVPLPDTETVLRQCLASQPDRLKRIPDGETGFRGMFTTWQMLLFQASPDLCTKFVHNAPVESGEFTDEQVDAGIKTLKDAGPLETGYDTHAIQSYATFKKLKEEGVIPSAVRFQVSLATPPNVLTPFVQLPFQHKVEPLYQDALYRSMRKLQDSIPHKELAIQIDMAIDTAFAEGFLFKPWFGEGNIEKIKEYIVDYTVRMIGQVEKDVEVGLHNCYGDMEHRHWLEPTSLSIITERGLAIFAASPHPINFFHCPVPKSALENLEAYLEPLKKLIPEFEKHGTDLYLGVVHYDDRQATEKMIEVAQKVLGGFPFGVATECGMGRTPPGEVEGLLKMSAEVSEPVY